MSPVVLTPMTRSASRRPETGRLQLTISTVRIEERFCAREGTFSVVALLVARLAGSGGAGSTRLQVWFSRGIDPIQGQRAPHAEVKRTPGFPNSWIEWTSGFAVIPHILMMRRRTTAGNQRRRRQYGMAPILLSIARMRVPEKIAGDIFFIATGVQNTQ